MDANTDLATLLGRVFSPSGASSPRTVSASSPSLQGGQAIEPLPPQRLEQVLEEANTELKARQTGLRFIQQDALPRPVIQIIDEASGEVLRQIPNEAAVRIAQALTGLLVDQQA